MNNFLFTRYIYATPKRKKRKYSRSTHICERVIHDEVNKRGIEGCRKEWQRQQVVVALFGSSGNVCEVRSADVCSDVPRDSRRQLIRREPIVERARSAGPSKTAIGKSCHNDDAALQNIGQNMRLL